MNRLFISVFSNTGNTRVTSLATTYNTTFNTSRTTNTYTSRTTSSLTTISVIGTYVWYINSTGYVPNNNTGANSLPDGTYTGLSGTSTTGKNFASNATITKSGSVFSVSNAPAKTLNYSTDSYQYNIQPNAFVTFNINGHPVDFVEYVGSQTYRNTSRSTSYTTTFVKSSYTTSYATSIATNYVTNYISSFNTYQNTSNLTTWNSTWFSYYISSGSVQSVDFPSYWSGLGDGTYSITSTTLVNLLTSSCSNGGVQSSINGTVTVSGGVVTSLTFPSVFVAAPAPSTMIFGSGSSRIQISSPYSNNQCSGPTTTTVTNYSTNYGVTSVAASRSTQYLTYFATSIV